MKQNNDINIFRGILMLLVIIVHNDQLRLLYPSVSSAILSFIMPAFLLITGYLFNVHKTLKDFAFYVWYLFIPFVFLNIGFWFQGHYLGETGYKYFDWYVFVTQPIVKTKLYWFLQCMMVCGILYYTSYHLLKKQGKVAAISVYAALLILVSHYTPFI